jgi:hypothetical protein
VNAIVSWPVARATLKSRLRSAGPWIVGIIFVATAALPFAPDSSGAQAFNGVAAIWFVVLTFALGTALLSEEIESGHAQLVLLRPLTRAAWFGGRLAGACAALALFCVLAWVASLAAAEGRGYGFEVKRLAVLPLAILWGSAWLSVLACLGAFLPGWTNGGALALAILAWTLSAGLVGAIRPQWAPALQTLTKLLGPQDPLGLLDSTRQRHDFGPALYDLVWLFGSWLAGVAIFNRRELARRRG